MARLGLDGAQPNDTVTRDERFHDDDVDDDDGRRRDLDRAIYSQDKRTITGQRSNATASPRARTCTLL